jgi:hypothetical protein
MERACQDLAATPGSHRPNVVNGLGEAKDTGEERAIGTSNST